MARERSGVSGTMVTQEQHHKENVSVQAEKKVWFFNAPVDLLFSCGGLLWIIVALHACLVGFNHTSALLYSPDSSGGEQALAMLLVGSYYAFTYPHHAATWLRIFGSGASAKKYWMCSVAAPLVCAGLFYWAVVQPDVIPWYIRLSGAWSIQHWVAQSFGVSMIYFGRAKFALSRFERGLIWWSCQVLIVVGVVKLLTFPQAQQSIALGVALEPVSFFPVSVLSAIENAAYLFWTFAAGYLALSWFKARVMPPVAVLVLLGTMFRITLNAVDSCVDLLVYGLPFYHSVQYLVITSRFYAKEHGVFGSLDAVSIKQFLLSPRMIRYYVLLLALGGAAYSLAPHITPFTGLSATACAALCVLLLNFHHLFTDAFIWQLKDPAVRKYV